MILVTNLSGDTYYLNPGLIETIEMIPDTLITMSNGKTHLVREPAREVASRIEDCRARIMHHSMDPMDPYGTIEIQEEDPDDAEE